MVGLLRFFLLLFILWLGFRIVFNYVLPWFLMHFMNKQQKKYNDFFQQEETKKEGDIEIKVMSKDRQNKSKESFGEYIDYEEIEQEKDE